jgi:hypothetical protein
MLAYLFWHTPKEGASRERYERDLLAFYNALRQVSCPGTGRSHSIRVWTLIEGAWALEELNATAVIGSVEAVQAAVARDMDLGYGGFLLSSLDGLGPHEADRAYWLSRPRGIGYRPVLEQVAQNAGAPAPSGAKHGRGALPRVMTLVWSVARVQPCDSTQFACRERPTFNLNLPDRVVQCQPFKFGQYELGERPIHDAQFGDQRRAHAVVGKAGLAVWLLASRVDRQHR